MPVKHKDTNRIKFIPFSERVAEVNVDVIHRIGHRNENDDDIAEDTYFHQCLNKWNQLNCSQQWHEFRKEIGKVQTLPQLMLVRERVVNSILKHLEYKNPLTLQAILEVVVALARDLRQEFYLYYSDVLSRIMDLLTFKESEILEWAFQCLAYLFKFLWRCMVRTIGSVLSSLLPLLSPKRPKYIHYFAADSFAFLARKVKDQDAFVKLILKHLEGKPEDLEGCGRLIYSWLRGIKGQLHSCAENVLKLLVNLLRDDSLRTDLLEKLLSYTLRDLATEIKPGNLACFWTACGNFTSYLMTHDMKSSEGLSRVMRLEHQLCDYCEGIHVTNTDFLIKQVKIVFDCYSSVPEDALQDASSIASKLLISPNSCLSQDQAVGLSKKVLSIKQRKVVLNFVGNLLNWGSFETLILPWLLEFLGDTFISGKENGEELQLLARLIKLKSPPVTCESDITNLQTYTLDFSSFCCNKKCESGKIYAALLPKERTSDAQLVLSSLEQNIFANLILPHLRPLNDIAAKKLLERQLNLLCSAIQENSDPNANYFYRNEKLERLMLLFLIALRSSLKVVSGNQELQTILPLQSFLKTLIPLMKLKYLQVGALRALDMYVSTFDLASSENENIRKEIYDLIYDVLEELLSAPHHLVRKISCHLLSILSDSVEVKAVFQLCHEAESIEANVTTYRDKLLLLQKLSYTSACIALRNNSSSLKAVLRFLFGSMYVNFKLLWEPLQQLVASYMEMPKSNFWEVYLTQLSLAAEQLKLKPDQAVEQKILFNEDIVTEFYAELLAADDKPDYSNYYLLLWQTSQNFSELCEMHNRDIVTHFLAFMREQYMRVHQEMASSCNIKKRSGEQVEESDSVSETEESEEVESVEGSEVDAEEDEEEEKEKIDEDVEIIFDEGGAEIYENLTESKSVEKREEVIESKSETLVHDSTKKGKCKEKRVKKQDKEETPSDDTGSPVRLLTPILLAQLGLLSKFRNPRVMYQEKEINRIYHDFLSHKNPDIQKAALECLMAYKHKFLTPYSQHLYALIDNKSYKDTMTAFSVDKDTSQIQEEHRAELIPIIMNIVYSKMISRNGMRTGGKGGSTMRRTQVLRFLAGCHEEEMLIFMRMAFRFFNNTDDDLPQIVSSIESSVNLENVIPPRRLQSAVNLLSVVQGQFGGLMGNKLLSFVLKLLVSVSATVNSILKERDMVHSGYIGALRSLRINCIDVLSEFFKRFESYPWTTQEIDTVLEVFVWPNVDRLSIEGVYSPTSLLKLFIVWSENPRYFVLLGSSQTENNNSSSILAQVMSLLLHPKCHRLVKDYVMQLIENLLTLKDYKDYGENDMQVDDIPSEARVPIPVSHTVQINNDTLAKLEVTEKFNYGSKLLFPYISSILERLRLRLAGNSKRGLGLNKQELVVLSGISEMISDPETSGILVELLLPLLARRCSSLSEDEEPVLKMLTSLSHFVKNVKNPNRYIRPLAPLFSSVNGVAVRKLLLSVIEAIARGTTNEADSAGKEDVDRIVYVITKLNAYDKRWVEQPDFDARLDAFKEIQTLLGKQKISVDLGAMIIHQCFYVVRYEKDMALRDAASYCLRLVAPALARKAQSNETSRVFLLDTTILTLIYSAIKGQHEGLRTEAVLLLGEMARKCKGSHPVLQDLNLLTDKNDPETDFFENLEHLQLHRKTRALIKICDVYSKVERTPNPRTFTQFILPLTTHFLCSEKYMTKNSIVDAAINAVGLACRLLPWRQYETVLRYYLMRLRTHVMYQKQLVRIVGVILDSFHFDLSRAQEPKAKEESANENQKTEIESENLEMVTDSTKTEKKVFAVDKQTTLSPSAAAKIVNIIKTVFVPQLHRALTARTLSESTHHAAKRQNQTDDAEEEEMIRVPIALPIVKLLQRLPEEILVLNLPGVFVKLCTFLKSRLESVRRVTRGTLQKVMLSLGPVYLRTLLHEMSGLLTKGFHVHVLIFSIHAVLVSLKGTFKFGDMDKCLPYITEVCKLDIFGTAAEEKEEKVAKKVQEARSTKSYDTLHLTAQFLSEGCLTDLLITFKSVIQTAHSHKIVNKASECLRQIVLGLSENVLVSPFGLLIFAVGVTSDSIPALTLKGQKEKISQSKEQEARQRTDCFIIKEAPKMRIGMNTTDAARVAARMNTHIFVEFGLQLIHFLLKKEKLKDCQEGVSSVFDSFVPVLRDCLNSEHLKVCTLTLNCLGFILRMDLPALQEEIAAISNSLFKILHKFAAAGLCKGDNFDLVVAAFKTVSILVRDVKYYTLDEDKLKALLLYAEQDMADINRHATAFSLLRGILTRKFIVPEIDDVMGSVAKLSITSDLTHVRQQARSIFHQFLMEYPLGKKLKNHLSFFLGQLGYELQPGRESALEMVHSIITSFPTNILSEHCNMFFLMLGARLVNDDSPDCRRMVAQCIGKLLGRLDKTHRDQLFNTALIWLKDTQSSHRRLAAQLCGLFVLTEKESFRGRLSELLPLIVKQFSSKSVEEPGQFVKARSKPQASEENTDSERMVDHQFYQVFQLIIKLCVHCPDWLTNTAYEDYVYDLTEHAQAQLGHPHEWVRLSAAQVITHFMTVLDFTALGEAVSKPDSDIDDSNKLGYFRTNSREKLKSMILDHCAQLCPGADVGQTLLFQIVKNLVIFADILKDVPSEPKKDVELNGEEDLETVGRNISLPWLVRRMRRVVNIEVAESPKSTTMRTMVLNWTAAIVVKLGQNHVRQVLHHLLAPIVRELSNTEPVEENSSEAQLRNLARDVGKVIRKAVGPKEYLQAQSQIQTKLMSVRAERKRQRKQEVVADPEKAAKRKMQKQVRKREAKKRKALQLSGKKFKRRRKEVDLEEND